LNLGSLLLVALALGLSNFAASIGIGLNRISFATRIRTGLAFGFFEALMPIAGLVAGRAVATRIGETGRYLGGALLVLTGVYALWQARRMPGTSRRDHVLGLRQLLVTAFALSLDNLVVGFGLSFSQAPILLAALLIAAVSVAMSVAGLELGERAGGRAGKWSEEIGALVLILVGIAVGTGLLH
jgi:putative Mn2+ efflux pump MntP